MAESDEPEAVVAAEAARILGLTQLLPAVYQDLFQPAARELGSDFLIVAKAVGVALAPFGAVVWGYDRIREHLAASIAARLARKPPADIKPPDMVIAGPIVMNMVFAAEAPHLREMYANLLARAMYAPTRETVHPSFVQLIQQLTPTEAWILKELGTRYGRDQIIYEETLSDQAANVAGEYISTQWEWFCAQHCGVSDPNVAQVYYHNLIRLGILIERSYPEAMQFRFEIGGADEHHTVINNNVILTEYGGLFLETCVNDDDD